MTNVVTIGGGTGSFITLRGIKNYPFDITAIVNTFDSGGSSGALRDEYGILPPGDIRRCLVALSSDETETILRKLFNYRFDKAGSLNGHSFGNLLLTALTQIEGDYPRAIEQAASILNCKGRVYPVSLEDAHLCAELEDGSIIRGEANIDIPKHDPFLQIKKVFLDKKAKVYKKAEEAILNADIIIIGPGDVYTSLIPNLLVEGVSEALKKSKAKKVYVSNLMTKLGETHGFKISQFAEEILKYAGIGKFDAVICNSKKIGEEHIKKYAEENKYPVEIDGDIYRHAHKVIRVDIFNEGDVLRHDSGKIAEIISTLI